MTDPYSLAGGECLRNKLGVTDASQLAHLEARIVSIRDVEITSSILPGEYNLQHLQDFHHFLFRDVYDWAGQLRVVDISKEGSKFCHWEYLSEQASAVLSGLEGDSWLAGRTRDTFVERLAHYYGELNALHPFREGNGRALRAFLRQLAASAGWRLDWSVLTREANIAASRHSFLTAETNELIKVLDPVVVRI